MPPIFSGMEMGNFWRGEVFSDKPPPSPLVAPLYLMGLKFVSRKGSMVVRKSLITDGLWCEEMVNLPSLARDWQGLQSRTLPRGEGHGAGRVNYYYISASHILNINKLVSCGCVEVK